MYRSLASIATVSLLTCLSHAKLIGNATTPIVDLGYAQYKGNTSLTGTNVFYGIHYAQPPVGELRWQPPQDIEAKNNFMPTEVLNAESPGPSCVQGTPAWRPPQRDNTTAVPQSGEEDCLRLDVVVPTSPKEPLLPVLVMIHGGGFTQGSSYSQPGSALVNTSAGSMVYVSLQYRLGVYGFLSSVEVRENGKANVGLLDQRAALGWVQRNIRAFGGDPARVTIIGGSAGGSSVMNQMIMYGGVSTPPFRAAISEYPWWQSYHNNTHLETQYRLLLSASSCPNLQCLRSLPAQTLKAASQQTYVDAYASSPRLYAFGDFYYGPSVDGETLEALPSTEFKRGHFTKIPLLVDHDGYEGYNYGNQSITTPEDSRADLQTLWPSAKGSFFDRLEMLYPREEYNSSFWQRQYLFGDFIINCPTQWMAAAVSDAGLPAYKLVFNAGTQLHGATSPFLLQPEGSEAINNSTLAAYMKDWFISFVTHLDPNAQSFSTPEISATKPFWPKYNGGGSGDGSGSGGDGEGEFEFNIMDVNYTQVGVVPDFDVSDKCDFWFGRGEVVKN